VSSLVSILFMIAETLGGLYVGICILRILLQAARADYYNPVSQFVVKATGVPVAGLRKIIPSFGRLDGGALIWAFIVEIAVMEILALIAGGFITPLTALAWGALGLLNLTLSLYYYGLMIVIIISFLIVLGGLKVSHPAFELVNQLMRPVMDPVSRLLPPMGGIDLSPILLFLGIRVLQMVIGNLAFSAGLTGYMSAIVPGI
jgi:YggT family protein